MDAITQFVSKNRNATLAAAAILASGVLAYSLFRSNKSSDLPALTEEETIEILGQFYKRFREKVPNFIQMANAIKQQYAAQGQEVSDQQVLQLHVQPVVESQMAEIQKNLTNEFNFDDDELEEAVQFYTKEGNEDIAELSNTIKELFVKLGGKDEDAKEEEEVDVDSFPKSQVVEMLNALADKMTMFSDIYCKQFIAENGVPKSMQDMQQFQQGLMATAEAAEADLLKDYKLTTATFQAVLMSNQADPAVGAIFHRMQNDNMMVLERHGIKMQMQ